MNALMLRHSFEQVIKNGKQDALTAKSLKLAKGYALNRKQLASISVGCHVYIFDRTNNHSFLGRASVINERYVKIKNGNRERRQDIYLTDVVACNYVDIPFIKGWETQRGVKVISKKEFENLFVEH
ncbi:hypothetical protein [Aliivibrio fischeri]|uniref:hypothetical protein n=1 Tax=Aliivibrio fischeri TaxID=668 RepID=UPI00084C8AE6|nr:hypothetical protein [Aliivibrio fischeri]OED53062.1 hypothetical protein BEI47_18235 [Aliivibrio fischeri]